MASLANQRTLLMRDLSGAATEYSPRRQAMLGVLGTAGAIAGYVGVAVGTLLWWPTLPIVFGAGGAAGAYAALRKKPPVAPIDLHPVVTAKAAVTQRGIARRLAETVTALTDEHVLAEQAVVRTRKGVLFRRIRAVPFLVELDGGDKLVVVGQVRIERSPALTTKIKTGDPRLAALDLGGIPIAAQLIVAVVNEGDPIEVTGEPATEIVPELAFHRDAGEATVMRGRAQAVVAIRA
ncbi:MAG TPA: hypothetical protein VFV99_14170 [Kofleriaceae bacterium]|nr:hypothetical protein [Kofleriaceae bacterium]